MPKCPVCDTPGAYVGFNSIECRNKDCKHFKIDEEKKCACCGGGHTIEFCPNSISAEYDDSGGNGPPSSYSAGGDCSGPNPNYSSEPPDWHGD